MQWSHPIPGLGYIGAVLDEESGHIRMTPSSRPKQRSHPIISLGCQISTVLDEESGYIYMTLFGRLMQRSRPILALGCYIGAVFDEESGHIRSGS
jgi:hypothetical protein